MKQKVVSVYYDLIFMIFVSVFNKFNNVVDLFKIFNMIN